MCVLRKAEIETRSSSLRVASQVHNAVVGRAAGERLAPISCFDHRNVAMRACKGAAPPW